MDAVVSLVQQSPRLSVGFIFNRLQAYFMVFLALILVWGVTACGGGGSSTAIPPGAPPVATTFVQLERLAVPALIELFQDFADHDQSNRATPRADAGFQELAIRSFFTAIGRPQAIADLVVAVTLPDVVEVDLSQPTGAYFGVELAGAGVVGPNFGGRRLRDDPVDVTLQVVFGDLVHGITEGQIPALTSDNVGPEAIRDSNTFPYLGSPL